MLLILIFLMRIAYFTHQYFPRHVGGTEVYTRGLARRAKSAGHEVLVLTAHDPVSSDLTLRGVHRTEHEGIPLVEIHYSLGTAPQPPRYEYENPYAGQKIKEELRRFKPDIVHVTHAMKLSGACLEACSSLQIPFIVALCDFWFLCPRHTLLRSDGTLCGGPSDTKACVRCLHHTHEFPDTWMVRYFTRRRPSTLQKALLKARRIIALSNFQKEMFVRNGFPENRIEVRGHGIEKAGFEPERKRPPGIPQVIFIGNLVEHKGVHILLEAVSRLKELPLECLIYGPLEGSNDYGVRLKRLAGSDPRIRFMGAFAPDETGRILSGARVLALPAQWYENDPLVVKAALYAGVPVLASNIGSLAEMIRPGQNGLLLPPNDIDAWADGLKEVLGSERMSHLSGEKIKGMDEHAAEIFAIYRQELEKTYAPCIEYLYEQLDKARIDAPAPSYVEVQNFCILRDSKTTLFQHPPSRVEFDGMKLEQNPSLSFFCGIKQTVWKRMKSGVLFEVRLRDADGLEHTLFQRELNPARRKGDRAWREERLSLEKWAHQTVHLIFSTGIPGRGSAAYAWAGWGELKLEHERPAPKERKRKDTQSHVFLITADALRPDFLACYGHPTVQTPHLDRLAQDGVLFEHARAHSPMTLGSYVSLLTGKLPTEHGINAEWGLFPSHLLNMPSFLDGHGYHTMAAVSESELYDSAQGFSGLFRENVPTIGKPAQDGAITTRRVVEHLKKRPGQPCFVWVQYFDTHPPNVPPEPFRSMFYHGNPSVPAASNRGDDVRRICGTEVVNSVRNGLQLLERGEVDFELAHRFKDTGLALQGKIHSGPDICHQLPALGKEAMRGMDPKAFGAWLEGKAGSLLEGRVDEGLLKWVRQALPLLEKINEDIVVWLDGVSDYQYPVSQYMGSISYLDAQIGALMGFLKEEGIYDQSHILFTAPHGELFGEHGVHFHHQVLFESALRVPFILKPASSIPYSKGSRIGGVFDCVDVFPTLVEALGLPGVHPFAGKSRWSNVLQGTPIKPHPSVALGNQRMAVSVVEGAYKFIRVFESHSVSDGQAWRAGDRFLFDLREDPGEMHNQISRLSGAAAALESRLAGLIHS